MLVYGYFYCFSEGSQIIPRKEMQVQAFPKELSASDVHFKKITDAKQTL